MGVLNGEAGVVFVFVFDFGRPRARNSAIVEVRWECDVGVDGGGDDDDLTCNWLLERGE